MWPPSSVEEYIILVTILKVVWIQFTNLPFGTLTFVFDTGATSTYHPIYCEGTDDPSFRSSNASSY